MTILFFARLFYPHIGGVETHVLEVGDRLVKQGHKIILVTEKFSDDSLRDWQSNDNSANHAGEKDNIAARIASWEIHRIPVGTSERNKKWKIWWWLWQHRSLMQQADVIHCHDVFFWFFPFRYLYRHKPVFTTFHGYETKFPLEKRAITIRRWSEELSWGNICVGDFIKKWYGTHPDFVTYGGVDLQAANEQQSKMQKVGKAVDAKKIRKKKIIIVFVGRLAADTGILAYDQAIGILNKKNIHDFEFVVVGDGNVKKNLENATFTASNEYNIYPYIKNAHIVFASSYLTILQTLAMKKPLIAFYDNPLKEDYLRMAPFARWISIENSSEKIAQRVLNIMDENESIAQSLKEAHLWVSGQTWDAVAALYLKLWKRKIH